LRFLVTSRAAIEVDKRRQRVGFSRREAVCQLGIWAGRRGAARLGAPR
jgi:hypothetical protein